MRAVIDELAHLDDVDVVARDRSPEARLEIRALGGNARLWRFVGSVALCWLAVVAMILGVVAVLR